MHELGIMESAMEAAFKVMQDNGASRILKITLRIGKLAAVDPEALHFAFEAVTTGSVADGAELQIEEVPTRLLCHNCNEVFTTESIGFFKCPECGEFSGTIKSGREIELARLELE